MSLEIDQLVATERYHQGGLNSENYNPWATLRKLVEEGLDLAARHQAIITGALVGLGFEILAIVMALNSPDRPPVSVGVFATGIEAIIQNDAVSNSVAQWKNNVFLAHPIETAIFNIGVGVAIGHFWKPIVNSRLVRLFREKKVID